MAQANGAAIHVEGIARINIASGQPQGAAPTGGMLMKRVTGIGGVFFKAKDPEKLKEWYRTHLGIESESWGAVFHWRDDPRSDDASTAWSVFTEETKYFEPGKKPS